MESPAVVLSKLSAPEFAAQLASPSGSTGVAVGDYMQQVNARVIALAHQRLAPPPNGRVLEIGFGNGKSIAGLLAIEHNLRYDGVEVSETMVAEARGHNDANVRAGSVNLRLGSVERLPFPDAAFDRALAVNTIYFWPDQRAGLAELRRVLRPDGWLILASITLETSRRASCAREEYGFRVPDEEALVELHKQAGFRHVARELYEENIRRLDGTTFQRAYHIVLARP